MAKAASKISKKPNVIVIVGPTASGKSDLAVELAKKFNGEVISADSRQVYKGMDIGTGKITTREMKKIPHHLLDVAVPCDTFTAQQFKTLAEESLADIVARGKTPIVCGGSGFYIQALIDNVQFPEVKPNKKLRSQLSKKSAEELFAILKALDKTRAKTIDPKNPHRLIRAIEIATALGKVPKIKSTSPYNPLFIGIQTDDETLKEKIKVRLQKRIKQGMVTEALSLHAQGLSWERMEEIGLEYRYLARYLTKQLSKQEFIDQLSQEIWHYAKRQKTWFKRDSRIVWFAKDQTASLQKVVQDFLD